MEVVCVFLFSLPIHIFMKSPPLAMTLSIPPLVCCCSYSNAPFAFSCSVGMDICDMSSDFELWTYPDSLFRLEWTIKSLTGWLANLLQLLCSL